LLADREAAQVRNHPQDLINVALERVIEASPDLPAYSTPDEMAAAIRAEVNRARALGREDPRRAGGLVPAAPGDRPGP
jgi:hypothetical protein